MLRSVPVGQAAEPVELAGSSAPDAPAPFKFPELPDQADALAPFEFPQPPDQSAAPAPFEFPAAPDQAQAPSARSGNDGAGPSSMQPPFLGEGSDAHGNQEIASGPTMSTTAHASSNGMPEIEQEGMPSIGQEGVPPLVQSGTIQVHPHRFLSFASFKLQNRMRNRDKYLLCSVTFVPQSRSFRHACMGSDSISCTETRHATLFGSCGSSRWSQQRRLCILSCACVQVWKPTVTLCACADPGSDG